LGVLKIFSEGTLNGQIQNRTDLRRQRLKLCTSDVRVYSPQRVPDDVSVWCFLSTVNY